MKEYLGGDVYVDFDGYAVVLTTESGGKVTSTIYLDPDAVVELTKYLAQSAKDGVK